MNASSPDALGPVCDLEPPVYIEELLRVLGMRKSSFFALRKSGRFPIPELWPPIGGRPR